MRARLIVPMLATAVLALGACNHEAGRARLETTAAPAVTPVGANVLAFTDDGANAKLAFMDAAPGAPGLMLECEHGARRVHLTRVGAPPAASALVLSSDGRRSTLAAELQTFEGRRLLTAEAGLDAPALRGFRQSAVLRVEDGDRTLTATAQDGREGAERFFAACEARA